MKMKPINTVSIWNPKVGQGKSMIAINLAAAAVQIGLKPVLVDQDLQGTLKLYDKAGHLPFDVLLDYPKSKKNRCGLDAGRSRRERQRYTHLTCFGYACHTQALTVRYVYRCDEPGKICR